MTEMFVVVVNLYKVDRLNVLNIDQQTNVCQDTHVMKRLQYEN